MKRNQWRTVFVAGGGMFCLAGGLVFISLFPAGLPAFGPFATAIVVCVGAVAGKSFGEHKVNPEPLK